MKKKIEPGETVRVKSKQGDMVVEITGTDERSGMYTGVVKKGRADGGEAYYDTTGHQIHVAPGQIRRE